MKEASKLVLNSLLAKYKRRLNFANKMLVSPNLSMDQQKEFLEYKEDLNSKISEIEQKIKELV